MDKKVHYKMHKVKKQWVTIAVTGLSLGAVSAVSLGTNDGVVQADEHTDATVAIPDITVDTGTVSNDTTAVSLVAVVSFVVAARSVPTVATVSTAFAATVFVVSVVKSKVAVGVAWSVATSFVAATAVVGS